MGWSATRGRSSWPTGRCCTTTLQKKVTTFTWQGRLDTIFTQCELSTLRAHHSHTLLISLPRFTLLCMDCYHVRFHPLIGSPTLSAESSARSAFTPILHAGPLTRLGASAIDDYCRDCSTYPNSRGGSNPLLAQACGERDLGCMAAQEACSFVPDPPTSSNETATIDASRCKWSSATGSDTLRLIRNPCSNPQPCPPRSFIQSCDWSFIIA